MPVCHLIHIICFYRYLTAGTTIASGLSYIFAKNTFRILRETKKQRKAAQKKSQQG